MSKPQPTRSHARRHTSGARSFGLSIWAATSINIAALITGLLLSLNSASIGWPYMACFAIAALLTTLLVEVRGLFLNVAQLPLLFGIITVITAWLVANAGLSDNSDRMSKTMILSAIFPLAQHFPELAITTAVCAIIALVRHRRKVAQTKAQIRRFEAERHQLAKAERRNRATTSRVRGINARNSRKITVDELLRERQRDPQQASRRAVSRGVRQPQRPIREPERRDTRRGRAVPPRREPGESIRSMPSVQEVEAQRREAQRMSPPPARPAQNPSPKPAPEPKRRLRLDDDLYS